MNIAIKLRFSIPTLFHRGMFLFDDLWDFSAILLQMLRDLIHGFGIRKEVITYFKFSPEGV